MGPGSSLRAPAHREKILQAVTRHRSIVRSLQMHREVEEKGKEKNPPHDRTTKKEMSCTVIVHRDHRDRR